MANLAPAIYGALSLLCLARGVLRPHRALVREGGAARCAGRNAYGSCDPTLAVSAEPDTRVYAAASGRVVAVEGDFVHILVSNEPVILMYSGIEPAVRLGVYVGRGQSIGVVDAAAVLRFSATELVRADNQLGYSAQPLPPSAWLAARGLRIAVRDTGDGSRWCEGGRSIDVPASAMTACDFKRPEPGRFGFLPIQVEMG